jgi:hypothetical protein
MWNLNFEMLFVLLFSLTNAELLRLQRVRRGGGGGEEREKEYKRAE